MNYCDDYQPHAVRRIYDEYNQKHYDFRWDEAGNLGQVSYCNRYGVFESGRFMYWTEDNRMYVAVDDKHYSYYAYDYSGERRIKLTGDNSVLDVNADFMSTVSTLEKVTLYPSAYMVLTDRGYTKHYYTGMERVAARIGDGGLDVGIYLSNTDSLHARANRLFSQSLAQVNGRVLEANDVDCIMDGTPDVEELGIPFEAIPEQMSATVGTEYGEFVGAMHLVSNAGESPEVYYYHGDHLGSASWITDASGAAVQHLQYLPYGERFVDQRTSGYSERFTFTGKERDEETGFGYFGARYMDHELMTMWLSVDPMADKYPCISPYAYCAWNPMKLVDPDGNEAIENYDWYKDEEGRLKWDPSVTKETKLKEGEVYLGNTVLLTNNKGQTVYGDEHGELHTSVYLAEVTITADAATIEKDANTPVPIAVPIGAFLWNQLSITIGAAIEAVAPIAWIIPACLLFSGDSSPNQDIRGGHDNNVRKSTKGKHEGGDSRRLQDQQGSKGEKIMKGKRPQGYKGPWPPKKKKK